MTGPAVLTIGHSNHPMAEFLELLRRYHVARVIDVRSSPFSRFSPQFNRPGLTEALEAAGISYEHKGQALGGRPGRPDHFSEGHADYRAMAKEPEFLSTLDEVARLAQTTTCALMCSEANPLECHRFLLVARALMQRGIQIAHILSDGSLFTQADAERQLMTLTGTEQRDLFDQADALERAYDLQAARVAYSQPEAKGTQENEGLHDRVY